MKLLTAFSVITLSYALVATPAVAEDTRAMAPTQENLSAEEKADVRAAEADNTIKNVRDRSNKSLTADDQSFAKSDTQLTAKIRQALVDDDQLSTYAQNVKIITQNGKVTLRGPVSSAQEKQTIVAKAAQIAGNQNIVNELEVAADKD